MSLKKGYQFLKEYEKDKTNLKKCYLFYGDEIAQIENTIKDILQANLSGHALGFNKSVFSLDDCDIKEVEAALVQVPLFEKRRFVILKGQKADAVSKGVINALKKSLSDIPSSTCLIAAFLESEGKLQSSNLRSLISGFSKYGDSVEFVNISINQKINFAIECASNQGVTVKRQAASNLVGRVAGSSLGLQNELDKLCAYCKGGEIKVEDVELLTSQTLENTAFELMNEIKKGDLEKALFILDNLLKQDVQPYGIVGALNLAFVDIYRAKCLLLEGGAIEDITSCYNYGVSQFRLKKAMDAAKNYSQERIVKSLELLLDVDYKSKSSTLDLEIVLQNLIVKMIKGVR